jgi:hypothetical protein
MLNMAYRDWATPSERVNAQKKSSIFMSKLRELLPVSGIPHSGYPESREERWCGQDNLENYRRHGGHPLYGEDDIRYRYNAQGYRCPEFDEEAEIRMISIGCSFAVGVGIPQEAAFHERFARRLRLELGATVVNWNLSRSGASNDYIARVLHLAVPRLNPDLVLVLFTYLDRREYMTADDRQLSYLPQVTLEHPARSHLEALSSAYDDQLNFFRNYKSVESLLADRVWLFSMSKPSQAEPVAGHLDPSHRTADLRFVDKARDQGHPGPQSHELIANAFWTKFVETGGLERLRRHAGAGRAPREDPQGAGVPPRKPAFPRADSRIQG